MTREGIADRATATAPGSVTRVLIANRGEIAVRLVRACHSLGIEAVAVYSDADADAPHVALADHAVRLGPEPARESYLDIDRLIDAARSSGADAVHPGYGFVSENPAFVERCVAAGLTFIGPSADAMRALGDKARAKAVAAEAGVPTVPEWMPDAVPADAYPVLVKAAAGGGGRGMRRVDRAQDLAGALESAAREAAAGFGDDTLIVEQLVTGARHVEVQLLADSHGHALYVGDRDCSLQRRHQKVVEEAPAPGLSDELRREMGEATLRLAAAAGYANAGTAEFLVAPDGRYFFLELNARLQVEHPVTEEAFGIDLAQWQLRIARGDRLDVQQADLAVRSHAIEVRLYAEDPVTFLPTGGEVAALRLPSREGVRIDHALRVGARVSLAYDPLLAKVIAYAPTREGARRLLLDALRELSLLGAITNAALLRHALELPDFVSAEHHVGTLEANLLEPAVVEATPELIAAARRAVVRSVAEDPTADAVEPFRALGAWRPGVAPSVAAGITLGDEPILLATERGDRLWFSVDGVTYDAPRSPIAQRDGVGRLDAAGDHASLTAPMPGTVVQAMAVGSEVTAGEVVVVLEAMKMENAIAAPFDGRVESIGCEVGDLVAKGAVLAEVVR
ncbi:MAG: carbamoyl-phosphate synthase subunit [Thermoleophilia bacterium]|nr:carbamoyl-phosphate synthase subunit [Thermoleophilia bacterium]